MNQILIHLLDRATGQECEILTKGLILFWWYIILPTTVTSIFIDQFNIIFNKAIAQVNEACPHLVNHWKNPFYHCYILIVALSRMIFLPMNLLLAFCDGRKDWWKCL